MLKWVREWFMLSMLLGLVLAMFFIFWAIWPLLPTRLPDVILTARDMEGVVAILMLLIILVGFGKLMWRS